MKPRDVRLDAKPSTYTKDYWMHAWAPGADHDEHVGAWIIEVPSDFIDIWWDRIRNQVQCGRLGHSALVSTALRHSVVPTDGFVIVVGVTGDPGQVAYQLARLGLKPTRFDKDGVPRPSQNHPEAAT
ncbi:MAG: hypothetical protein WC876_03765 [Candidatus Thermoplasmatota archaeon]|jgi:hypothetical protein